MTRLERKNRKDVELKNSGGLTDIFDDIIKQAWRINDDEYDYIAEYATDEEADYFVNDSPTYQERRKAIAIVNRLVSEFRNNN